MPSREKPEPGFWKGVLLDRKKPAELNESAANEIDEKKDG
jgi:hypothetical protein